jgi:hypothetical protein
MTLTLESLFQQLFDQTNLIDNTDNRREINLGIKELHNNYFTLANMLDVAEKHHDVMMYGPKRRAVISSPENTRAVLDVICQEFPWLARTDENLKILFDWLWRNNADGGFNEHNVRVAVQALGRSALESVNVPPPVVVAPPPPPPPQFDWSSVASMPDVPLTDPAGAPPPTWFLNKLSREQIRSFVARDAAAKRPKTVLPDGELALDASQEQLLAATPQMLARLLQRQRAAKYGGG